MSLRWMWAPCRASLAVVAPAGLLGLELLLQREGQSLTLCSPFAQHPLPHSPPSASPWGWLRAGWGLAHVPRAVLCLVATTRSLGQLPRAGGGSAASSSEGEQVPHLCTRATEMGNNQLSWSLNPSPGSIPGQGCRTPGGQAGGGQGPAGWDPIAKEDMGPQGSWLFLQAGTP